MTVSYDDHLALARKEISSRNFCVLVDVAVRLYEEDHPEKLKSKCHNTKTKTLSVKEEESDKRFFHLFPRKTRTSVKKFVTRRRNRNWASTSSSLVDIETEQPRISLQWFSSSSSSSSFLGDYKFAAHSQNPTPPPSSTLLVTAESEKTEMINPPNPNSESSPSSCITENTNRKRRAVQETKRNGKAKKAKVAPLSWKGRETPESLVQLMEDMNGSDPRLIFEKTLTETDVNPVQSRLLMPFKTLIRNDFLTPVELRIVEEDINNDDNVGVGSILVDQRNVKWGVIFKRRDMKKDSGGSLNYAFICGCNDVVKCNRLKDGDNISIWSFRWCQILCFAIVPSPTQ